MTGLATKEQRPNLHFDLINPKTGINYGCPPKGWRTDRRGIEKLLAEDRILWPVEESGRPRRKLFERELSSQTKNLSTVITEPTTRVGTREIQEIFAELVFDFPKPSGLIQNFVEQVTGPDSLILDSFAGSGTTAHAVLAANAKDGGNRRFILIECEDYADTLTAERVRRVIQGYPYSGTQREELLRKPITWSIFEKKHQDTLQEVAYLEQVHGRKYDTIKKEIKDGVLTVTGERKVKEQAPGLGGSFTYCELGEPIAIESLLTGEGMPSFEALARYVFYTATGKSLEKVGKPAPDGFIGETDLFRIHLIYTPDRDWLRSNAAALSMEHVEKIEKGNTGNKRAIVFAVAKFMSQKVLTERRIEFCQLPYAVHRILGD